MTENNCHWPINSVFRISSLSFGSIVQVESILSLISISNLSTAFRLALDSSSIMLLLRWSLSLDNTCKMITKSLKWLRRLADWFQSLERLIGRGIKQIPFYSLCSNFLFLRRKNLREGNCAIPLFLDKKTWEVRQRELKQSITAIQLLAIFSNPYCVIWFPFSKWGFMNRYRRRKNLLRNFFLASKMVFCRRFRRSIRKFRRLNFSPLPFDFIFLIFFWVY